MFRTPLVQSKPFLVLAVLAGLAPAAWAAAPAAATAAAAPWESGAFTADPQAIARAAAKVESEGDDVVVLLMETRYSFDEAGRETYEQRLVYKILTASAHESWSTLEESWEPWHQARPEVRARVITPDGAEHPLDPTTLSESSAGRDAPDMFEDGRVLRAPLPATRQGAVVEQQVTVRDTSPFFDGGVVRLHSLDPGMPVRHARVTLEAPAALPLRWVARELPGVSPREEVVAGRRRLTFEARDLEAADDPEPGLPSDVPRVAYIAFSTGKSWSDLARRYSEIVDRSIQGADIASFLRAATAGSPAASQLDTINRLLARMSDEVRYTGMELGEGGLIPRTPAETLKRRFGDCKDKAVLLTALLRAVDVPAYVALLNAGEDDQDVEESLPGFGLFNHAIVVVPGSPALWIDPTDPYARAGELPVADQGRLALVASPTAAGLVRTPEATAAENRQLETRDVYLADLGPSRIVETSVYQGAIERDVRALYSLQDASTVRQALKDYATAAYLGEDLAAVDHSKPGDLSVPMQLRLEVKNARRGFTDERSAAVGVSPASLLNRLPEELIAAEEKSGDAGGKDTTGEDAMPEARESDYVFSRPSTIEVRYRIVPPVGYAPQPLPAARTRQLGPAMLSEEYAAGADNVVTATFRLDTGKRRISAQEFETMRTAVRAALQDKVALLTFDQVGESRLSAGQVREALAEFQRLAALSPKAALPHTRIARALLAGGMGEAAREEARRAVQLEPKLAPAWRHLGWVLQHDEIGRRFGAGFDRAGAIAAYRKARELDPKDLLGRTDLAILLEHDAAGVRYSPRADLGAAIDEYRAIKKDLGARTVDDNLLIALVRASRFPEAKELAAQMKDSPNGALYSLVATAAIDGVDAAVREGERSFSDDRARASALQTAAQTLMLARRYPEAAALMERAGRQTDNPAALLSLADMLRRARKHEEIVLPKDQPTTPGRRLLALAVAGRIDVQQTAALFSRELAPEILKTGAETPGLVETGLGQARRQLRSQDVPADVALDLALGAVQEGVTGDDTSGYRVGFSFPFKPSLEVYVVPDGGEYRIAALSTAVSMLGDEALRRAGRGDLAGARKWLDWALEETGGIGGNGAGGVDPIPQNPFAALWTPGSAAGADDIRCAAAVLTATRGDTGKDAKGSPLLGSCRDGAADPARRNAFEVALAFSAAQSGRFADLAEASRRLLDAAPASEGAAQLQALALVGLNRWDDLRAFAEQRLQRSPDAGWAREMLSEQAIHAGDLDRAETQLRQTIQAGKASANDFNQLAWLLLERGRVDDAALDFGQRAATLSEYKQPAFLHTLACLYAETGRTAEAYRIILQSIGTRLDETPGAEDWYVFGRLAEQYGLPDVARKYYRRVALPKDTDGEPMSTHALAARRLAALGDERKPLRRAAK